MVNPRIICSTIVGALLLNTLVACNGSSPFKRQSNPIQDYPKINESVQEKKGLVPYSKKQDAPVDADNSQAYCTSPFLVSVSDKNLDQQIVYKADESLDQEVQIRALIPGDFTVTAANLPADSTFTPVAGKSGFYTFSYHPGKSIMTQEDQVITLNIDSSAVRQACHNSVSPSLLYTSVKRSSATPDVSLKGLPKQAIADKATADFTIEVTDTLSDSNSPPQLLPFTYSETVQNMEGPTADASKAVQCDSPQAIANSKKWQIKCTFDASRVKTAKIPADQLAAIFNVSFISQATKMMSAPVRGMIMIDVKPAANDKSSDTKPGPQTPGAKP